MSDSCPHDPFANARIEKGILDADLDGDKIPLILRYKDLRKAARDTGTFSSDTPCRVPIPAEEDVRSLLQQLSERLQGIEVIEAVKNEASEFDYLREVGYQALRVKFLERS